MFIQRDCHQKISQLQDPHSAEINSMKQIHEQKVAEKNQNRLLIKELTTRVDGLKF